MHKYIFSVSHTSSWRDAWCLVTTQPFHVIFLYNLRIQNINIPLTNIYRNTQIQNLFCPIK
jgi:hypothetical protein